MLLFLWSSFFFFFFFYLLGLSICSFNILSFAVKHFPFFLHTPQYKIFLNQMNNQWHPKGILKSKIKWLFWGTVPPPLWDLMSEKHTVVNVERQNIYEVCQFGHIHSRFEYLGCRDNEKIARRPIVNIIIQTLTSVQGSYDLLLFGDRVTLEDHKIPPQPQFWKKSENHNKSDHTDSWRCAKVEIVSWVK